MAQLSHVLMEANPLLEGGTLDASEVNSLVVMDPLRQLLEGQDVMMEENLFALTMWQINVKHWQQFLFYLSPPHCILIFYIK